MTIRIPANAPEPIKQLYKNDERRNKGGRPRKSEIAVVMDQLTKWEHLDFDGAPLSMKSDGELQRSIKRKALESLPHLIRMSLLMLNTEDMKIDDRTKLMRFIKDLAGIQAPLKDIKEVKRAIDNMSDDDLMEVLDAEEKPDVE